MKKLALYGAGTFGMDVFAAITGRPSMWARYDEVFFVDDDAAVNVPVRVRVVRFADLLHEAAVHDVEVAICVDNSMARRSVRKRVADAGIRVVAVWVR